MNILKCDNCNLYTLKKICPKCNKATISSKPAKYNPLDTYGLYRRIYKKEIGITSQGL